MGHAPSSLVYTDSPQTLAWAQPHRVSQALSPRAGGTAGPESTLILRAPHMPFSKVPTSQCPVNSRLVVGTQCSRSLPQCHLPKSAPEPREAYWVVILHGKGNVYHRMTDDAPPGGRDGQHTACPVTGFSEPEPPPGPLIRAEQSVPLILSTAPGRPRGEIRTP